MKKKIIFIYVSQLHAGINFTTFNGLILSKLSFNSLKLIPLIEARLYKVPEQGPGLQVLLWPEEKKIFPLAKVPVGIHLGPIFKLENMKQK